MKEITRYPFQTRQQVKGRKGGKTNRISALTETHAQLDSQGLVGPGVRDHNVLCGRGRVYRWGRTEVVVVEAENSALQKRVKLDIDTLGLFKALPEEIEKIWVSFHDFLTHVIGKTKAGDTRCRLERFSNALQIIRC